MVHQPTPKFMLRQLQMLTALPPLRSRRAHKIRGSITVVMLCATSRRNQTSRARASSASTSLVFPMRACGFRPQVKPETSRFPRKELPHMPGSKTTPSRTDTRNNAPVRFAFRRFRKRRRSGLSSLRGSMAGLCAPLPTLRRHPRGMTTHGSGAMRIATPSLQWVCTAYSLPVSTGAPKVLDAVEKLGLIAVCRRDLVISGASHSENRDDGASG